MTDSTAKSEAMQAVRLLRGYALSHELTQAQIETLYQASRLLEGFIERAQLPPKPLEWFPSDKPWDTHELGGFHLLDEVKVKNSNSRWFVIGLDFNSDEIVLNMKDYHHPLLQERYKADDLTFVSHGKSE